MSSMYECPIYLYVCIVCPCSHYEYNCVAYCSKFSSLQHALIKITASRQIQFSRECSESLSVTDSIHSLTMASANVLVGTNSENDDLQFHVEDGAHDVNSCASSSGDNLVQCGQGSPNYELLERDQEQKCSQRRSHRQRSSAMQTQLLLKLRIEARRHFSSIPTERHLVTARVILWTNSRSERNSARRGWVGSDCTCIPPAASVDNNYRASNSGSPQSLQGQQVSNPACTDEGQPCSQETHIIGRAGHKRGVKIKRNRNWIDAAMAVAISTINKGMGIRQAGEKYGIPRSTLSN